MQAADVVFGADFHTAEALEVRGGGLRVEQFVIAVAQAMDQMHQSNFAGIALVVEHAFAEERSPQAHSIQPAHQISIPPGLDAVSMSELVELAIDADQLVADPASIGACGHAGPHDIFERGIDANLKPIPVVMLTSSREERDLAQSYALGANAYVVKPVEFQQFISAVKELGVFWGVINEPPPEGS